MRNIFVGILVFCAAAPCVAADAYPGKPVRWVVPFPPGGGTDLISRTIASKLSELWGTQVVADNRPGGGGTIGLGIAAKTLPDGYTIVLGQASNVAVAPALYGRLPYRSSKRFTANYECHCGAARHRVAPFVSSAEHERAHHVCEIEAGCRHFWFTG